MKKTIEPKEIIRLLEIPTADRRPIKNQLRREAYLRDLIQALRIAETPLTRRILCDIIGYRYRNAKSAIPILLDCLNDPDWKVRSDAAEALERIGDSRAGETVLLHFKDEALPAYAYCLGWLHYQKAIPTLKKRLKNNSAKVRVASAIALSMMPNPDVRAALLKALNVEKDEWAKNKIKDSIANI